jgi:hypothetical protein
MDDLTVLPIDIQNDFGASVVSATPTKLGVYRLVAARRTKPKDFESQRITVRVVDEDGIPMEGIPVAFSYSTADQYTLTADFQWQPLAPHRAFLVRTGSAGQIDMILGAEGVVKAGQAGGVAVYVLTPEYSSDVITGCGMLSDHTGMHLTMQLRRTNVVPAADRLAALEAWVATFDERLKAVEGK